MSGKIFNINFTDPTKSTISLSPQTLIGPSGTTRLLDMDLTGMGYSLWGEVILKNILHVLENFACSEDIHTITSVNTGTSTITFSGNVVNSFIAGTTFDIFGSDTNDGSWVVSSSGYVSGSNETVVVVSGALNASSTLGSAGHQGWPNKSLSYSPTHPTEGQIWYNQTRGQIFTYTINTAGSPTTEYWKRVQGISISDTVPISPSEGDLWWETTVYGTSTDQYGRNLQIYISGSWVRVVENYLPRDGSKVMTGILNMGTNRIEAVADPNSNDDAVNLGFADTRYVNVTGDTMTGYLVLHADPISDTQAATKRYVDTVASVGFNPVRADGYNIEFIAYTAPIDIQSYHTITQLSTWTAGQSGVYRFRVRVKGYTDNTWYLYKNSTLITSVSNSHSGFWYYDRYLSDKVISVNVGDVIRVKVNTTHSSARAYGCWIHVMSDFQVNSTFLHSGTASGYGAGELLVTPLENSPAGETNTLTW